MSKSLWNIQNRMIGVAAAAVLAIIALGGIQYLSAEAVRTKTADATGLNHAISLLNEARLQNVEMVLAAMDSIVDRAEGVIQPERQQVIGKAVDYINAQLDGIIALGNRTNAGPVVKALKSDFAALAKAIQTDLRTAIETNADDAAFARIDDVIDAAGEQFTQSLTLINENANKLLESRLVEAEAAVERSVTAAVATSLAALAIFLPLVIFVTRNVVGGLSGLTTAMTSLAAGNLETVVPFITHKDELGTMAGAVQVFKDNAGEINRLRDDRERQERAATEERRSTMMKLAAEFEASVKSVVDTVSATANEMSDASGHAVEATGEAVREASAVASSSEQTSGAVQAVATAAEELSSSIAEINRQVSQSAQVTQEATSTAQATNDEVRSLAAAADKIGDVISLIQDIAEQTNLLALNATIEAARAGEAGKGFAVVASEVKSLANQTARATEEISGQIAAIQSATTNAVNAIGRITATTDQINSITASVAASVEEQGAATQEISRSAQEAASNVQETVETIRRVSEQAEETGRSVQSVSSAAGRLETQLGSLKGQVETFIARIRSA